MSGFIRRWLGSLILSWKGPFKTSIYYDRAEEASDLIRPDNLQFDVPAGITCQRVVYHTVYKRWWVPDETKTQYEVQGHAPKEFVEQREGDAKPLDPRLFEKVVYPLMCNKFLEWTPFPYYYAIQAFLARLDD
jgi:hypothetical protein